jgi:AraC-like DNA-binding protein
MKDVFSDVLDTVAVKGTLYFRTHFSPPFAIGVPPYGQAARFHLVVQGRCTVTLPDGETMELSDGDLVLIPHGSAHVLADRSGREVKALEAVLADAGYTGEGALVVGSGDPSAVTKLVCGHCNFADGADHPLLRALPSILYIPAAERARFPVLDDVLKLIARLIVTDSPGVAASLTRLSELVFIEALRLGIERSAELKRLASAVYDPQVGKALGLIHRHLDRDWTLDSLASEVGMSRSRFAERFQQLVGTGPIGYLADWRLQRARALLAEPRATVADVSHKVGYSSQAAFSRAFSRKFGHPPRDDVTKQSWIRRIVPNI